MQEQLVAGGGEEAKAAAHLQAVLNVNLRLRERVKAAAAVQLSAGLASMQVAIATRVAAAVQAFVPSDALSNDARSMRCLVALHSIVHKEQLLREHLAGRAAVVAAAVTGEGDDGLDSPASGVDQTHDASVAELRMALLLLHQGALARALMRLLCASQLPQDAFAQFGASALPSLRDVETAIDAVLGMVRDKGQLPAAMLDQLSALQPATTAVSGGDVDSDAGAGATGAGLALALCVPEPQATSAASTATYSLLQPLSTAQQHLKRLVGQVSAKLGSDEALRDSNELHAGVHALWLHMREMGAHLASQWQALVQAGAVNDDTLDAAAATAGEAAAAAAPTVESLTTSLRALQREQVNLCSAMTCVRALSLTACAFTITTGTSASSLRVPVWQRRRVCGCMQCIGGRHGRYEPRCHAGTTAV